MHPDKSKPVHLIVNQQYTKNNSSFVVLSKLIHVKLIFGMFYRYHLQLRRRFSTTERIKVE